MKPHSYSAEDLFILACISKTSDKEKLRDLLLQIADWESFLIKVVRLRMASLIYQLALDYNLSLPEEIKTELSKHYFKTLHTNILLYKTLDEVLTLFEEEKIFVLPLKGIFLAEKIYRNPAIRPLSDIDLLIKEDEIETAIAILKKQGYQQKEREYKSEFIDKHADKKHVPMLYRNGVGFELHLKPLHEQGRNNLSKEAFWNHTIQMQLSNHKVFAFEPVYLLLLILLHLDEHDEEARLHFVGYVDVVWIIDFYAMELDWQKFIKISCDTACEKAVFAQLDICVEHFQCVLPEEVLRLCKKNRDKERSSRFHDFVSETYYVEKERFRRNWSTFERADGVKNKLIFLLHDLFPDKHFMLFRYKPTNPKYWFLYYPVRLTDGVVSLCRYILHSLKKQKRE